MTFESKKAALADVMESAIRDLCRSKVVNDHLADLIVKDLLPRIVDVPMYRPPEMSSPPRTMLSKRDRRRFVDNQVAEVVRGINDHTDEMVGFFVQRMLDLEIEMFSAKQATE